MIQHDETRLSRIPFYLYSGELLSAALASALLVEMILSPSELCENLSGAFVL